MAGITPQCGRKKPCKKPAPLLHPGGNSSPRGFSNMVRASHPRECTRTFGISQPPGHESLCPSISSDEGCRRSMPVTPESSCREGGEYWPRGPLALTRQLSQHTRRQHHRREKLWQQINPVDQDENSSRAMCRKRRSSSKAITNRLQLLAKLGDRWQILGNAVSHQERVDLCA